MRTEYHQNCTKNKRDWHSAPQCDYGGINYWMMALWPLGVTADLSSIGLGCSVTIPSARYQPHRTSPPPSVNGNVPFWLCHFPPLQWKCCANGHLTIFWLQQPLLLAGLVHCRRSAKIGGVNLSRWCVRKVFISWKLCRLGTVGLEKDKAFLIHSGEYILISIWKYIGCVSLCLSGCTTGGHALRHRVLLGSEGIVVWQTEGDELLSTNPSQGSLYSYKMGKM